MPSITEAAEAIARLPEQTWVAIDTETTGLDLYAGDVTRGVSVAYRTSDGDDVVSDYYPVTHPNTDNVDPAPLVEALRTTRATHIYHNAGFDWTAMEQLGLDPQYVRYYDSNVLAWMQNENNLSKLKVQAERYLGADSGEEQRALKRIMAGYNAPDLYKRIRPGIRKGMTKIGHAWAAERAAASKKTWATLTGDDIAYYAAKDTDLTLRLMELQRSPHFMDSETLPWLGEQTMLRTQAVVHRMVKRGVKVDLERSQALAREYNARIAEIEAEFAGQIDNLNSNPQLARLVYGEWGIEPTHFTDTKQPSVNQEALLEMEGDHPGVSLILEHRGLSKMVGTYLNPMNTWSDDEHRIHSSLNVTGTVTGRFSSSHPNLQNIPKNSTDDTVKKLYIPSEGFELVEYDLHSAELYVGASVCGDMAMQAALSEPGRNFHKETAQGIFGRSDEPYYTLAKNLNYGIPYGIGAKKFALYLVKGLRKPFSRALVSQAQGIIDRHRKLWPVTHKAIRRLTNYADEHDYIPMIVPGRFRHFSGWTQSVPAYTAFNAVVQGGVAEIMKLWMLESEGPLIEWGARMVLQVHDSLWIEQPPGIEPMVTELLQSTLDGINPVSMRLTIDAKRLN